MQFNIFVIITHYTQFDLCNFTKYNRLRAVVLTFITQYCIIKKIDYEVNRMKRTDYIDWDEYFMGIAMLSAERSKDNSTQVGACIVNADKRIVSVGYNGMPTGCCDDEMPWERESDSPLNTKYPFVCHAELNAILNSGTASLNGCKLYVTLFPCNECAKAIIQCGIRHIIYRENKYADTDSVKASMIMFKMSGVKIEKYEASGKKLTLNL